MLFVIIGHAASLLIGLTLLAAATTSPSVERSRKPLRRRWRHLNRLEDMPTGPPAQQLCASTDVERGPVGARVKLFPPRWGPGGKPSMASHIKLQNCGGLRVEVDQRASLTAAVRGYA